MGEYRLQMLLEMRQQLKIRAQETLDDELRKLDEAQRRLSELSRQKDPALQAQGQAVAAQQRLVEQARQDLALKTGELEAVQKHKDQWLAELARGRPDAGTDTMREVLSHVRRLAAQGAQGLAPPEADAEPGGPDVTPEEPRRG